MNQPQILPISHLLLIPSALNPRKHFSAAGLAELKIGLLAHGFKSELSHLLVRPAGEKLEIVCGERRWRACGELLDEGYSQFAELPCIVEEMSDSTVLELQLIENIQRNDLTALEEAEGCQALLKLESGQLEKRYTVKTLAGKIGRSEAHIGRILGLCKLRDTAAGQALEGGLISISHAYLLARLPAGPLCDEITRRTIQPMDGLSPIPVRLLEQIIREECMVDLRGAQFDQADANLVPLQISPNGGRKKGGACSDCPFNTKNSQPVEGGESSRKINKLAMCLNPECFREKTSTAHNRWVVSVSDEAAGRVGLLAEEAARIFDFTGKKPQWNSGYIDLVGVPSAQDLRTGVTKPPTWGKLLEGQALPIALAKDSSGKVHELVKHDLALELARDLQKDYPIASKIFRVAKTEKIKASAAAGVPSNEVNDAQVTRLKEERLLLAQKRAVIDQARRGILPPGFWPLALETICLTLVQVVPFRSCPLLAEFWPKGMSDNTEIAEDDLLKHVALFEEPDRNRFIVASLLTMQESCAGLSSLNSWANVYDVNLKQAKKDEETVIKAEERAAAEKNELLNLIVWKSQKKEVEQFDWNEFSVAANPDEMPVIFPKSLKWKATVEVARSAKGWHVGNSQMRPSEGGGSPCSMNDGHYDTRTMALRSGLLAIQQAVKFSAKADAVMERYLAAVAMLGEEPVAKKKKGSR